MKNYRWVPAVAASLVVAMAATPANAYHSGIFVGVGVPAYSPYYYPQYSYYPTQPYYGPPTAAYAYGAPAPAYAYPPPPAPNYASGPPPGYAPPPDQQPYVQGNGEQCREYDRSAIIDGKKQMVYGNACRQPDGSWKIVD